MVAYHWFVKIPQLYMVYGAWIQRYCVSCYKTYVLVILVYWPCRPKIETASGVMILLNLKKYWAHHLTYFWPPFDKYRPLDFWCLPLTWLIRLTFHMMTSSNGNIFRVTSPLWGESTGHWWIPLTKASNAELDVIFHLRLNKRLRKQLRLQWFETPSRSLWRYCNEITEAQQ